MPTSGDRDATDLTELLGELRRLGRNHPTQNPPGEYRRLNEAYCAALIDLPQIPRRQCKNVYEQTLYANWSLSDAIDAAIERETTRTVRIEDGGMRIETVRAWGGGTNIEAFDTETGGFLAGRERVHDVERVLTEFYVQLQNNLVVEEI